MATVKMVALAQFIASKVGATAITVTCDVDEYDADNSTVDNAYLTAQSMTHVRNGIYRLFFDGDDSLLYVATAKTSDSSVDQQHIPAVVVRLERVNNADVKTSTRNATVPLDASATEAAAEAALAAYDAATGADVSGISVPSAATVADAVWDEALAGHATAGSAGAALSAAGGAADPLLNDVPGSYGTGTGGYALGRLLAISNAALYSPATRNNQFLLAAAIQGALRPVQQVTWLDGEGVALDLTDATITGIIRNRASGATRAIAGDLDITQATSGIFTWSYDAADVADAGQFDVQFTATWDAPALSPARTFTATWAVHEALVVPD